MNKFWNNKKVLVTGGAGFIGSSLVKFLVKNNAKVSVIDNLWRGKLDNLKVNGKYVIDIEKDFFLADLTEYSKCLELIKNYDYVYHLADVVAGINYVFGHEYFIYKQNILINTNTLSACVTNGIKNYIYVGTACSFPKHLQDSYEISKLSEDQTYPASPESSYGWSKLMGEYEAELSQKNFKINVGLLRFHNVYGPGVSYEVNRSQVLPSLIRKAVNYPKEKFVVWGSGEQYRDFVYIDDVVNALDLVAQKGMNKGLLQIGSGEATKIKEAAYIIAELSKKNIKPAFDTKGPTGDVGRISDSTRANKVIGWYPQTNIKKGLKNLYKWVEEQMKKDENI